MSVVPIGVSAVGTTRYCRFNTYSGTMAPITLAGTPVVKAFKNVLPFYYLCINFFTLFFDMIRYFYIPF